MTGLLMNAYSQTETTEQPNTSTEAAATPPPLPERIPEKYRVAKEDGTVDIEASTGKLLEGYTNLEKRLGSGDAPPKTVEEYAPEVPEGFDLESLKADPMYQDFLKGAHGRGVSNKQLGWILEEFGKRREMLAENVGQGAALSVDDLRKELAPVLGDDPKAFDAGVQSGLKAIRSVMPNITQEQLASIPNHPIVFQLLAAFGKEVGEDTRVSGQAIDGKSFDDELNALIAHPGYSDKKHPEHKSVMEKKAQLFARRYGKR